MKNIKLVLEYDGTLFNGWQIQPQGRTVQGVLEQCLHTLLQEPVKMIAAGRTDAGVHARGQVVNFQTKSELLLENISRGLNSLLPQDIVVHRVLQVPLDFHARYDAIKRRYLYRLSTRPTALHRHLVWIVLQPLDLRSMRRAAEYLVGTHDFGTFCREAEEKSNCFCTVEEVTLKRSRDEIHLWIVANRFLHSMVRIIMGRLVEVGRGRISLEEFSQLLNTNKRQTPMVVAPPQGLCLFEIIYPRAKAGGERRGR